MTRKARNWDELRTMFRSETTKLYWGSVSTRWHVYPSRQPMQLIARNWQGTWFPQPDGSWYLSPVSFDLCSGELSSLDLQGNWTKHDGLDIFMRESEAT